MKLIIIISLFYSLLLAENEYCYTSGIFNNSQKKGVVGENMTEEKYVPDGWKK